MDKPIIKNPSRPSPKQVVVSGVVKKRGGRSRVTMMIDPRFKS